VVVQAIAQVIGVADNPDQSTIQSLLDFLAQKEILLVLDSFEQLVEAAPTLLKLLEVAPALKILVTSREALQLRGEQIYPLDSLSLPSAQQVDWLQPDKLMEFSAIALFMARAKAQNPAFALTEETAPTIAALCLKLDGLPLAIELMAAQVTTLPLNIILERFSLKYLSTGSRDLPDRQRTIRVTLDWSYDSLTEDQKTLFVRLALFKGGCRLEAAEAICNLQGDLALDIEKGLIVLVSKNLLRTSRESLGNFRYYQLQVIHEYALEKLAEKNKQTKKAKQTKLRQSFANFFLKQARQLESRLNGTGRAIAIDELEADYSNFCAALKWLTEEGKAEPAWQLGTILGSFWQHRGFWSEGYRYLEATLVFPTSTPAAVRAKSKTLHFASILANQQGNYQRGENHLQENLQLYTDLGDLQGKAITLNALAIVARRQGEYSKARNLSEEGLQLAQQLKDNLLMVKFHNNLGLLYSTLEEYSKAEQQYQAALNLFREIGDKSFQAAILANLATINTDRPDYNYPQARNHYQESLKLYQELNDRGNIANVYNHLGNLAYKEQQYEEATKWQRACLVLCWEIQEKYLMPFALEGLGTLAIEEQPEQAAFLYGVAENLRQERHNPLPPDLQTTQNHYLTLVQEKLGEPLFKSQLKSGRTTPLEEVVRPLLRQFSSPQT
jgi:predicted ATPase